jgi:hypothetical protein
MEKKQMVTKESIGDYGDFGCIHQSEIMCHYKCRDGERTGIEKNLPGTLGHIRMAGFYL